MESRGKAVSFSIFGFEGLGALRPIQVGVMELKPWDTKNEIILTELSDEAGDSLCVLA